MANANQTNETVVIESVIDGQGNEVPDGSETSARLLKLSGRGPASVPQGTAVKIEDNLQPFKTFTTQSSGFFVGSFDVQPGVHKYTAYIEGVGRSLAWRVTVV